jgi:hypothetical protein
MGFSRFFRLFLALPQKDGIPGQNPESTKTRKLFVTRTKPGQNLDKTRMNPESKETRNFP